MSFTLRLVKGTALTWAEFDNNLSEIEAKWLEIVTISGNALAAANFVGQWNALTGPLGIPAASYWSGKFWMLLADVADVTAHEPGVSASWAELVVGNVLGPVSATAGNIAVLDATGKVISDGGVAPAALMPKAGGVFTGDVTVPSINGGQLAGLRNKIINGNFDVWQRGTSFVSPSSGGYVADRWAYISTTAGNHTISRQAGSASKYAIRAQRNSGASATGFFQIAQIVEGVNVYDLSSRAVTLSFRCRCGANFSAASSSVSSFIRTGTTEDQGGVTATGTWAGVATFSQNNTATTSWQTFTQTVTLGAGVRELVVIFSATPTGTAGADDWFEVEQVQFEVGSVDTPFEHRPYGTELALCQRYYYRMRPAVTGEFFGKGYNISTTQNVVFCNFPVSMRAAPATLEQSGVAAHYELQYLATAVVCNTVPSISGSSTWGARIVGSVASGLTAGQGSGIRVANTSAYLGFSAEL